MLKQVTTFFSEYYDRRHLIWEMALRDFRSRYTGSAFGLLWALIQPLAMMLILFFVFSYGLKAGPHRGTSFIAWFFSAVVAWNFFQDALTVNVSVYQEYAYLVKKLNFRLAILPFVKILSSLILHVVFLFVVTIIIWVTDGPPTWHFLQLLYYVPMLIFLLFGVSWICSTLNVFFRDVGQMVNILTQMGFWGTPIIWKLDSLPERFHWIIKLNPVYYIIEGYRKSLIYHEPIWADDVWIVVYYWVFSIVCFGLGTLAFKRLKPHFADVL